MSQEGAPVPMMCGMPSPRYVRSIQFQNQSAADVTLKVHFQSGQVVEYTVGKDHLNVERQINHGGYSTVDPIIEFKLNGQLLAVNCIDAQSIERRVYVINENKTVERKHE